MGLEVSEREREGEGGREREGGGRDLNTFFFPGHGYLVLPHVNEFQLLSLCAPSCSGDTPCITGR